jgi:hypothetical protein
VDFSREQFFNARSTGEKKLELVHSNTDGGVREIVFPQGRPKEKCAPSGGREVHEVTNVGTMFMFIVFF